MELFYDDYVFMHMTETNLISVVHLLCLVHLPILSVVDACLHVMYGDLIRMAGFVVATDMAAVAGARATAIVLAVAVAAPKVVDVGADAPEVMPTQGGAGGAGPPMRWNNISGFVLKRMAQMFLMAVGLTSASRIRM